MPRRTLPGKVGAQVEVESFPEVKPDPEDEWAAVGRAPRVTVRISSANGSTGSTVQLGIRQLEDLITLLEYAKLEALNKV